MIIILFVGGNKEILMNKNAVKKEDIAVYESLRNEIISTQGIRSNMIVYMYTVFVVLFGLGVEISRVFFFVAVFVLLSFQAKINRCKQVIARISAYIIVYFEKETDSIHWETANAEVKDDTSTSIAKKLSRTSSIQLGVISLISFIVKAGYDWYNHAYRWNTHYCLIILDIALLLIIIACVVLLVRLNDEYDIKEETMKKWEDYFSNYKDGKNPAVNQKN